MNIKGVKHVLPILMRNNIVPYLHGRHGLGKTQVVKQVAETLGIGFVPLYLSTQEVGDLIGLLDKKGDGTVYHTRPEWFPTEGSGIIFLDEINRAHPDVLQAMLPFALDKTLHKHKLPPGWSIVCAGNYQSNSYTTTDMSDSALNSRFCHLDFLPTAEEFIMYVEEKGHDNIAAFIRDHSNMLEEAVKSEFDTGKLKPNRRAWCDFVAPLEREVDLEDYRHEVYTGIVGSAAASAFLVHKKTQEAALDINKILKNYKTVRPRVLEVAGDRQEVRLDYLNSPLEELLVRIENKPDFLKEEWIPNIKQFLLDIPMELAVKAFKRMGEAKFNHKKLIVDDVDFCKKVSKKIAKTA
jgi:hypothetical protein